MIYQSTAKKNEELEMEPSLRMISMRIQTDVISKLKKIASDKGLGYQPYIRMLLTEHIKSSNS